MSEAPHITRSSGNVYEDLGYPDPETALAKAKLAHQIGGIIKEHGWTQEEAASVLGIDQPRVSKIIRGRLREFSTERLMDFLRQLDQDITITVQPKAAGRATGGLSVSSRPEPMAASSRR